MPSEKKWNVLVFMADHLRHDMLGCNGNSFIRTPNVDRLASEGVQFDHYYGCSYCAPARASLLTGRHDCHAGEWTVTAAGIYKSLSDHSMTYEEVCELISSCCGKGNCLKRTGASTIL